MNTKRVKEGETNHRIKSTNIRTSSRKIRCSNKLIVLFKLTIKEQI